MTKATGIKILFNDAHSNVPWNNHVPQGGPSSFARKFTNFFHRNKKVELISILFSHNDNDQKIFSRLTKEKHDYYEIVYPREKLINSYKKDFTYSDYKDFLKPWLKEVEKVFMSSAPDVVFLNGFSLSNWMIMETAYKLEVPICIQHAGVWKKELQVSQPHFSNSIRKIFFKFEKEIIEKTSHQIFLNEFSRDYFFKVHNVSLPDFSKVSVIPLPKVDFQKKKIKISHGTTIRIGAVARWDNIKNHSAIARLAEYTKKNDFPLEVDVVTSWSSNAGHFKDKYRNLVNIIPAMEPSLLKKFYDDHDVILLPSLFDVSPTVVMEALLRGKPTIISNMVGWSSDYRKYGLEKLIVDTKAGGKVIFDTIQSLYANSTRFEKRLEKLLSKVIDRHDEYKVLERYYKIFKNLSHASTK